MNSIERKEDFRQDVAKLIKSEHDPESLVNYIADIYEEHEKRLIEYIIAMLESEK